MLTPMARRSSATGASIVTLVPPARTCSASCIIRRVTSRRTRRSSRPSWIEARPTRDRPWVPGNTPHRVGPGADPSRWTTRRRRRRTGLPPISIGAYQPGIAQDAITASASRAGGAPALPNGTRSPVSNQARRSRSWEFAAIPAAPHRRRAHRRRRSSRVPAERARTASGSVGRARGLRSARAMIGREPIRSRGRGGSAPSPS